MLGRTNLLYVPANEATDFSFATDYILTQSSGNIIKIENCNGLFFVFTSDENVLYGSNINSLKTLKNGSGIFAAKHIIFADGVYYMTKIEKTVGKAVIYKSADLTSFEEITLKTGKSNYKYPVHGLYLNSAGEIVALIEEDDGNEVCYEHILIIDSLTDYEEGSGISYKTSRYTKGIYYTKATSTTLKNDRIFTTVYVGSTSSTTKDYMITLDGNMQELNKKYSFYANGYFYYSASNKLYYSLNGIDYVALDFSNVAADFSAKNVFEYDGYTALFYSCTENGKTVSNLTVSLTPKGLIEATASAIPASLDYEMIEDSNVYNDEYVYIGCTGGVIVKAKIDELGATRPDISLLKTLSAKQALAEANEYTERLFAALEERVATLEEAAN